LDTFDIVHLIIAIVMLSILVYLVFTLSSLFLFLSWNNLAFYIRRIFIFSDTKQKLKAIREYDAIYIYGAFFLIFSGMILCFIIILYLDFISMFWSGWNALASIISTLERGEMNYTCSFGISYQTVKCEVFASINRGMFILLVQFLKWMQDSFSLNNGFNIFKIGSTLSLFYFTFLTIFRVELFYTILRRGFNNLLLLFYATVYSLHAIHNWRDIVVNAPNDEPSVVNVNDEAEDAYDGAHAMPFDATADIVVARRVTRHSGGGGGSSSRKN
jgi:hypothetical protein